MTMQAVFNSTVIAESDEIERVGGTHYFPEESVRSEYVEPTRMKTICFWKGLASYYTVTVGDQSAKNVAWQYRRPSPLARKIKRYYAFDPRVQIVEAPTHESAE